MQGRPAPVTVDLTTETAPAVPAGQPLRVGEVYDPARTRESMRGWIALVLLILFALEVGIAFMLLWQRAVSVDDLAKIAAVLLSPVATLLGTVIGFYFGSSAAGGGSSPKA